VVGFFDARDLAACSGNCSWTPRAGSLGPLTGTATVGSDGWVMNPRMSTTGNTGITGSQAYTSMVGFKLSSGGDAALRTLVQIGGSSQCRAQLVTAAGLRFSGCVDAPADITAAQQTSSSHVWAVMHDGGTTARSYWNGAYFTHTTSSTWSTADGPLYVGRSVTSASTLVLPGGVRFVLLLNRALSGSEVAAVARWSWETHGVGLDLMNFSPSAWTGVSVGQVYWTPPAHMQPLSSRTVRLMIDISSVSNVFRVIVRFGQNAIESANTGNGMNDRMIAIGIFGNSKTIELSNTRAILNSESNKYCASVDGPILATFVYTRTSSAVFINGVKDNQCSGSYVPDIADTDNTRIAQITAGYSSTGFRLRSLQLLDYAMSDLEAQTPVIIGVTPQVLLASNSSVTVTGSPFAAGAACSALFIDGSVSTNCSAVSPVEIVVMVNASIPSTRSSLLVAVTHNGLTFRAPVACVWPFFAIGPTGSCARLSPSSVDYAISFSDRIAGKANATVTLTFTVPLDVPPGGSITITYPPNFFAPSLSLAAVAGSVLGLNLLCTSTSSTAVVLATSGATIGATAAFTVTISGFTMGAATPGSISVTVKTSSDASPSSPVSSGPICQAAGSGGAVSLSNYVAATTGVALTLSLVAAPALNSTAFKLISITGLRFSALSVTAAPPSCSNLNPSTGSVSAAFTPSTGVLLLNLSTAAAPASPPGAVVCTVAGFTNAAAAASAASLSVSTFDAGGGPLQTQGGVEFPSIFPAAGSRARIMMSSYIVAATNVTGTVSFFSPFSSKFKTVSVTGVRFDSLNASSSTICYNIIPPTTAVSVTLAATAGLLVFSFSNEVHGLGAPVISLFAPGDAGVPTSLTAVGSPQFPSAVDWRTFSAVFFNNPGNANTMSSNYYTAPVSVSNQMTYAAWIRSDNSYFMTVMGSRIQPSGSYCFQLELQTNGVVQVWGWLQVGSLISAPMPSNQFFHVAFSRASNFESKLYINGTLQHTLTGSSSLPACQILHVGGSSDFARGFNGYLQDVRVYDRVLSSSEVSILASMTPTIPSDTVTCSVPGLVNAASPSAASITARLSTFSDGGVPLQTQGGLEFPATFAVVGGDAAISLSNYVVKTISLLTVSFAVAAAQSANAFKLISITGLRFSALSSTTAPPSCFNLNPSTGSVSAAFTPSTGVLLLNLSTAAAPASPPAAVVCTVAGFTNAAAAVASASLSVSTFDARGGPLQTQGGVEFPSIFPAAGSRARIMMSSYIAAATNVTATVSFFSPFSSNFKTVSVTGVRFDSLNASSSTICYNIIPPTTAVSVTLAATAGLLVFSFSNEVHSLGAPVISLFAPGDAGVSTSLTAVGSPQFPNAVLLRAFNTVFFNNPNMANAMSSNYYTAPLSVGQQMTVAVWVRTDNSYYMTAMGFKKNPSYCFQLDFFPNGRAHVYLVNNDGLSWNTLLYSAAGAMPSNQFVHVAFSRASNFESKLYLNGVLQQTLTGSASLPGCDTLYIGGSSDFGRGFNGYLQDARVYDRVLCSSEVSILASLTPTIPSDTVTCSVPGLVNAALPTAASSTARLSTFNNGGMPLQTQGGLEFPATFAVVGGDGAISLSNYVVKTISFLTLSFAVAAAQSANAFKLISITGLRFSALSSTAASPSCSNLNPSTGSVSAAFTPSSGVLLLNLSNAATPASPTAAVVCTVAGLMNAAAAAAAAASVSVSTFDAGGWPLQTQPNVRFPEILYPRVVTSVSPCTHPSTAQMSVAVYGSSAGLSDWSGGVRTGATSCVSTQWQSETLVTCRTARVVIFGWAVTASILLNRGSLTGAFSYSGVSFNITSLNVALPTSGSVQVTVDGNNFGSFNPSPSAQFGDTACESSFWKSSSSLLSKAAGRFSRVASVAYVLTVAQFQSRSTQSSSLLWFQNASVADWRKYSNTPSTGSAHAVIIGRHLGSTTFSARNRFTGSASQLTQWLSDSCILLRTSGGVVSLNSTLIVTFPGWNMAVIGTLSSALSYNTPSPSIATSQRLSNISVTGSNFGPYLAVVPRTTSCINAAILPKYSSVSVCNSSDLNIRDAGITVTEAAVSIAFSGTSRLDDVIILLQSPQGKEYTLMRGKCYGALPCGMLNSVAFNFQILPISQLIADVPLIGCPSSGTYVPDANDVSLLRSVLLSYTGIGDWFLRVVTGSQN